MEDQTKNFTANYSANQSVYEEYFDGNYTNNVTENWRLGEVTDMLPEQIFCACSFIIISVKLVLITIWILDIPKTGTGLSWLLIFLKLLADILAQCPVLVFSIIFMSIFNPSALIDVRYGTKFQTIIFFHCVYFSTLKCLSFSLKLNFLVNLERYLLLKLPLTYKNWFKNRNIYVYTVFCLIFDITTVAIFIYKEYNNNVAEYEIIIWFATLLAIDLILIILGLVFNILALYELRQRKNLAVHRRQVKPCRVLLFLFGISLICLLIILPFDVLCFVDLFSTVSINENVKYLVCMICTCCQTILYPVLCDLFLVSTDPMIKKSIAARFKKILQQCR